jgi:hypothetical protein
MTSAVGPRASLPTAGGVDIGGLTDLASDRPASRANTFTYTLKSSQRLASPGISFTPGETRTFSFVEATNSVPGGTASHNIAFKRQYHRHLQFGLYADRAALPAAARLPDLLAEEVRAVGDLRPARRPRRPVVAVRARPAPTLS